MANGGAVSIGDQLHPRGKLNEAVYDVIGEAFRDVEAVEKYCVGAKAETEIGLLILNPLAEKAKQGSAGIVQASTENVEGASKMLLELHHQFDLITSKTCDDFAKYKILVIPDRAVPDEPTVARLREFVAGGGKILLSHHALLDDGGEFALAEAMGVSYIGAASSNPDYYQMTAPDLFGPVSRENFAYCLYDGPSVRVSPEQNTEILADAYQTYFNRTGEHFISHGVTCPLPEKADYPAVTQNGGVIYIYGPIFSAYQKYGALSFRALVGGCLNRLLPDPIVKTDAPASAEVTLMRQEMGGETRRVVHVVNYSPQRRGPAHVEVLDAPVPLHDVSVGIKETETIKRAFVGKNGTELPITKEDGYVSVVVPRVQAHEMVVFSV